MLWLKTTFQTGDGRCGRKDEDKNAEEFYAVRERIAINKARLPKEWLLFACKSTRREMDRLP